MILDLPKITTVFGIKVYASYNGILHGFRIIDQNQKTYQGDLYETRVAKSGGFLAPSSNCQLTGIKGDIVRLAEDDIHVLALVNFKVDFFFKKDKFEEEDLIFSSSYVRATEEEHNQFMESEENYLQIQFQHDL